MSRLSIVFWIVLPYACLVTFIVGHYWRYRFDQFGWTSRSSQLYERKMLQWGSILFHYGALAAIGGHVLGLFVPASLTEKLGLSEQLYHFVSVGAGTVSGIACVVGFAILVVRRLAIKRVALTTTRIDVATYTLLAIVMLLGMSETVGVNLFGGGYDYRSTVSAWFRGILLFNPQPALIASAPLVYRLHALAAFMLFALWPFSRLVHAWSVPFEYLWRPPIVYRSRNDTARR
jgi:nitrate reductase gamma subunit